MTVDDPRLLTMSAQELGRLEVIRRIDQRLLTQRKAAQLLGLSVRQVERLVAQFRATRAPVLISKKHRRPSNHRLSESFQCQLLALVRERFADFGPTLAQEKLLESHQLKLDVETMRTTDCGRHVLSAGSGFINRVIAERVWAN